MAEARIDTILRQLRTRDSHAAWSAFIDEYAPLIFDVARRFERDPDNVADCFQFVCERLYEGRFRRLLKFTPQGPAKFSTWLRAVVRNLCLDRLLGNGVVTTDLYGTESWPVGGVALQPTDGKIVVAGSAYMVPPHSDGQFAVARYWP